MKNKKNHFVRRLKIFLCIFVFCLSLIGLSSVKTHAYTAEVNTFPLNGENVSLHLPVKSNTNLSIYLNAEGSSFKLGMFYNGSLYMQYYPTGAQTYDTYIGYLDGFYTMFYLNYTTSVESGITYYDFDYGFIYYSVVDANYLILNETVKMTSESISVGVTTNDVSIFVEGSQIGIDTQGAFLIADFGYSNIIDSATNSINFIKNNFDKFLDYSYDSGYAKGYNDGVLGGDATSFTDFGTVILQMVNNFLSFEILPNFSLLNVLHLCLTLGFVFLVLRFFVGG